LRHRRLALAITVRLAISVGASAPLVTFSTHAHAQTAARDQSGSLSAAPAEQNKSWLEKNFGGSSAEISTYIGSGTFYASGYHDPYVSNALYLRPSYHLGTKYGLTLNTRLYLEEEYTLPDSPNGRRFNPLDTWFWLSAKNLYTHPRSKIRLSGVVRAVVPTSYESRYAHMVTALGVGLTASRGFEFGRPDADGKRWNLALSLGGTFSKYFRTSDIRGSGPGDTTGCRSFNAPPPIGATGPGGLPAASESDRCGGTLSTSFATNTSVNASLSRRRLSLSATFILINEFRYQAPDDALTSMNAVEQGRSDATWSIVAVSYELTDHFGLSAGLSTFQPALNTRENFIRFPFFDFTGTNANNFSQVFVSVSGSI
jgi:hypothetical protein